ncbi:hypothetical protein [Myceligenerans crystallogenes]|uniref:MftR C-terminal domain-containing protein n=1 Tax=Myceligenerans crystallogenes TaxID=316335 RepID=A0ABP4ZWI9_9MICO
MEPGYLAHRELIELFHGELDSVLQGRKPRPRGGLDAATCAALAAIAAAWPSVPAHLVGAAEDAFAAQLGVAGLRPTSAA